MPLKPANSTGKGIPRRSRTDRLSKGKLGKRDKHRAIKDLLGFYKKNYSGMTVTQLRRADRSLYQMLWRKKLLHAIPATPKRHLTNPLAYYQKHHKGLSRGRLAKKDKTLYRALVRSGEIDRIPTRYRYLEDPLGFYHSHYAGLTRGQLQRKDCALYKLLLRRKLLSRIPTVPKKNIPGLTVTPKTNILWNGLPSAQ